ncbi:MFS transporter [Ideonella sp.]|uniref:MFS transporter n=1 Tax=Ideonella sp. TaxID=1929293 RepID=UPI003BB57D63
MNQSTNSVSGRIALMVAHCAGMIDLVALPVWIGTLVARFELQPQQAGLLVTLFLAAAVLASLTVAPRFSRLPGRLVVSLGFAGSALALCGMLLTREFAAMAALHALAGFCAGAALSMTHGTIARSSTPHRLFALVGTALGFFSILFMGMVPPLVAQLGGNLLFAVFAGVMGLAALVSWLAFPEPEVAANALPVARGQALKAPLPRIVWFGILGISCMALAQAMTFSFLERVGDHRGFGMAAVNATLIALGIVTLFPAPLAAVLEKRLPSRWVLLSGPVAQAALAMTIMNAGIFGAYAAAASVFAAVMIFTHTFAFSTLARLDPTGRALAATPAMLMIGAAIGPILGGTLVQQLGYGSVGLAAALVDAVALFCFLRCSRVASAPHPTPVTAA